MAEVSQVELSADKPNYSVLATVGTVTFTAAALDGLEPQQYQFWVMDLGTGQWHMKQDYSADNTWPFTPAVSGSYLVYAYSRESGSSAKFEAEASMWFHVVDSPPVTALTLTSDQQSPVVYTAMPGPPTFFAQAYGGVGPLEYQFRLWDPNVRKWSTVQDYSTKSSVTLWQSEPPAPGSYMVLVYARSAGSNVIYEARKSMWFHVVEYEPVKSVSLASDVPSPNFPQPVRFTASHVGGVHPHEFQFWVMDPSGTWSMVQDYSYTSYIDLWDFTPPMPGSYLIRVYARSYMSKSNYEAQTSLWHHVAYYEPVTKVVLSADKPSFSDLATVGTVTFTANAFDGNQPREFQFWIKYPGESSWTLEQGYGESNTLSWTPSAAGNYEVKVFARGGGNVAWMEALDKIEYNLVEIPPVTSVTLTSDQQTPVVNTAMPGPPTFFAQAYGGVGPEEYQFWLWDPNGTGWSIVQDFHSNNSVTLWMSGGPPEPGSYKIVVYSRSSDSKLSYEARKSMWFHVVEEEPVKSVSLVSDVSSPSFPQPVRFTASSAGGTVWHDYQFWVMGPSGTWSMVQDYYYKNNIDLWTYDPPEPGSYLIRVYARSSGSNAAFEAQASLWHHITYTEPVTKVELSADKPSYSTLATLGTVTFTASALDGNQPRQYQFWIKYPGESNWTLKQGYGGSNTLSWTPTDSGSYEVKVFARGSGSVAWMEAEASMWFHVVDSSPVTALTLTSDQQSPVVNTAMPGPPTFFANALDGVGPQEYQFRLWDPNGGRWSIVQDYSTTGSVVLWQSGPPEPGSYMVLVHARSSGSKISYEAKKSIWFHVVEAEPVKGVSLISNIPSPSFPQPVRFTASPAGGVAPHEYQFWVLDPSGTWSMVQDYSTSDYTELWNLAPPEPGSHLIRVYARSYGSKSNYEAQASLWHHVAYNEPVTEVVLSVDKPSYSDIATVGTVTFTANALDGNQPQQFRFWIKYPGESSWTLEQDYGVSNTLSWTPSAAGSYEVKVFARGSGNVAWMEAFDKMEYNLVDASPVTALTLTSDPQSPVVNTAMTGPATFSAQALDGAGPQEYKFRLWDPNGGGWSTVQDYSTISNVVLWQSGPPELGSYMVLVLARSSGSKLSYEARKSMWFHVVE